MAGTVLSAGVVFCAAALTIGFSAVGAGAVLSQRIAGVADAAALAAADAASGAISGVPCELARHVATVSGASLVECEVDGVVATVSVSTGFGRLSAVASARAGPPE